MTHFDLNTDRRLVQRMKGMPTTDGAGVKLTRIIGTPSFSMLDPFLLLDCFESDQAQDYIGGFPEHPHRGFETVTYLLNGRMRHKDNAGHEGVIESGGVQWMTAGKGIIHSEMPEQEAGLLKGFQLWVNLPALAKMTEPEYQEFSADLIPVEQHHNGTVVRVIIGKTDQGTVGAVRNHYVDPFYFDIDLPANTSFIQTLPQHHNAFVYVLEGELTIDGPNAAVQQSTQPSQSVYTHELGVLSSGDRLAVSSGSTGTRFLMIAGRPLHEPVARGGPFVMNTKAEILQAFNDLRRGTF